nr:hypothetical protein [Saprospiraceae bacterium]
MSPILRFLLFIVLYFKIVLALPAQHPFRKVDYLGDETGIKSPPTCITEDDKGFFWVGTDDGLYRFDGAHARQIFYKPEENLGFGRVSDIEYEPATGRLWICSDRGICRYDLNVKTIDRFNPEDYFPKSEIDKGHECIYQDRQGTWWGDFNTKGLTHFSPDDKQADRYVASESQLRGKGVFSLANTVLAVTQDARHDSIIWAGTRCGLIRVNKVTKTMQYYLYRHPDDALMEASNAMTCLLSHPNGRLYIGTWNGGLLDFDPATQQFRQYFPDPGKFDLIASKNNVYALLEDGSEAFWVSSSMGICRFNIPNAGFTLIKKGAALHYKDTKGDFWAFNGKLLRYNRFKNQFPIVPGLTGRVKRFLVNTPGNEIYIKKYDENGVLALDPDKQTIRRLPFPGKADATADGDVLEHTAMGLLTNNREQLFLLPKDGSNFAPLYALPSEAGWIFSRALPDGGAVLTGDRGYLFHFKPGERAPDVYPPAVVGGGITGFQDGLQVMAVDRFGRAWLGSSGGYCIFDPYNRQFLRFPYQNAPDKIFQDIREFFADGKGRMWCIGQEELGWIDQAHPEQGIQQRYDR